MDLGDFFERIRIQWDHILILSPVNKIVGHTLSHTQVLRINTSSKILIPISPKI